MSHRKIGVGLYGLTGVYGSKSKKDYQAMLEHALSQGVDFIDMAESYGDAEAFAGKILKPYRHHIQIATKLSPTTNDNMDASYDHIIKACKASLKRLGADYIDLYQIHYDDPNTPAEATLEALESLREAGDIRHYGLGHIPYRKAQKFMEIGSPHTLMIEFHPLCIQQYQKYLDLCQTHGVTLLTMGSTGRGLLAGKIDQDTCFDQGDIRRIDPLFHHGKLKMSLKIVNMIKAVANRYDCTPVQIALNWIIHKPCIHRALVGSSTIQHLDENLGCEGWMMRPDDYNDMDHFIQQAHEDMEQALQDEIAMILDPVMHHDHVVADMVYVLEALIENEQLDERYALPLFSQILSLKRDASSHKVRTLKHKIRQCML